MSGQLTRPDPTRPDPQLFLVCVSLTRPDPRDFESLVTRPDRPDPSRPVRIKNLLTRPDQTRDSKLHADRVTWTRETILMLTGGFLDPRDHLS